MSQSGFSPPGTHQPSYSVFPHLWQGVENRSQLILLFLVGAEAIADAVKVSESILIAKMPNGAIDEDA